jgi:hypothetical protein
MGLDRVSVLLAVSLFALDANGAVVSELSIARTPPPGQVDDEAIRIVAHAKPGEALPSKLRMASRADGGRELDVVPELSFQPAPCPASLPAGGSCAVSKPFRLVMDDVDRRHPRLADAALIAELGGSVTLGLGAQSKRRPSVEPDATLPVSSAFGKSRVKLRVRLVRLRTGGPPPVGRDVEDAIRLARQEIDRASSVWGVCGVSFGPSATADVKVVDPPPPHLLSLGCDAPATATGGELVFNVDGQEVRASIAAGTSPRGAARRVAAQIEKLGFRATVSDNRAAHSSSLPSSDVLVTRKTGLPATLSAPKRGPLSSDGALDACIGRVSLEDGLQHFSDSIALSGTLEERTLIKAFDDGDPSTLDVFVVPSFGGDARIGESFIFTEHGAIRNVVVEDRAGLRAQRASFTLAHEIGHVLLDQPGHPDDFLGDMPTSLMDADAVNATSFGPRRLSVSECARAQRQSGPRSLPRLLGPWTPKQ